MKIYRYWETRTENIDGTDIHFKAGSDVSQEDAGKIIERNVEIFRAFSSGKTKEGERLKKGPGKTADDAPYEIPVCEEICETLDEHNIVTRNRYGALVLNSEDHVFLDLDPLPPSFGELFASLFGRARRDPKERLLALISGCMKDRDLAGCPVRVYETCKGYRVLLGLRDLPANSAAAGDLMRRFRADPLYASLCARQNCYRARLTPKPARIPMKTAARFRFPYREEDYPALRKWLGEYSARSEDYAVCRLTASFGPDMGKDPVTAYHDRICRCSKELPLA